MATGTLELVCEQRGERSVLATVRFTGLARSSRLPARGGAARVMLSTLGPGMLGGDRFVTHGRLEREAALVATGQMATPVFPGSLAAAETRWEIADGAMLCTVGQPIVPLPGSAIEMRTTIDVTGTGHAIVAETLVPASTARLRGHTIGSIDGIVVLRDVVEFGAADRDGAVGTVYLLARDPALRARGTATAWAVLDGCDGVRGGAGGTDGAVVVRLCGGPFAVQRATTAIAEALLWQERDSTGGSKNMAQPGVERWPSG